jgi:ABC-2 type transport system permease protein
MKTSGWKVVGVLCRRDLARFLRQPVRIAAAVGTPLLIWIFFSSGFAGAFRAETIGHSSYTAFMLPGAMTLIAVFAAIFSSISIIEDRQQGWLQSVLVAPVPRWSIALGKICGGASVAFAQSAVLLLAIPFLPMEVNAMGIIVAIVALALTCMAMAGLGVVFAWKSETTAGFHAVMNLVFMPMWLLSGAFFSISGAAPWLAWVVKVNPLTWCTQAIRLPLLSREIEASLLPLAETGGFAIAMIALATLIVGRRSL